MSAATINRAANDPELRARVLAMAHKEIQYDEDKAESAYGKQLLAGTTGIEPLMWPVAVDTEAQYESALLNGRGAPGHDADIITDAALTASIGSNWPWAEGEGPQAP